MGRLKPDHPEGRWPRAGDPAVVHLYEGRHPCDMVDRGRRARGRQAGELGQKMKGIARTTTT